MKRYTAFILAIWVLLGSLLPQAGVAFHVSVSVHSEKDHEPHTTHEDGQECPNPEDCPLQKHICGCHGVVFLHIPYSYSLPTILPSFQKLIFGKIEPDMYRFQPENTLFSPPKFLFV